MKMPKKFDVGAAILAEYVAQGAANKITIVNAYSGNAVVPEVPLNLTFGLYVEIRFKGHTPPSPINFEVSLNGNVFLTGRAEDAPTIAEDEPSTIMIPMFPVKIEQESTLEMHLSAKGFEKTLALRKKLLIGPVPTS